MGVRPLLRHLKAISRSALRRNGPGCPPGPFHFRNRDSSPRFASPFAALRARLRMTLERLVILNPSNVTLSPSDAVILSPSLVILNPSRIVILSESEGSHIALRVNSVKNLRTSAAKNLASSLRVDSAKNLRTSAVKDLRSSRDSSPERALSSLRDSSAPPQNDTRRGSE